MKIDELERRNSFYAALASLTDGDRADDALRAKVIKHFVTADRATLQRILNLSDGDFDRLSK